MNGPATVEKGPAAKDAAAIHFAWRGWILGVLFLILGWARFQSDRELLPYWLALALSGAAYRLYAGRSIGGHSNSLRMGGDSIAVSGPYVLGRHPLYLANVLTAAGLLLFANCLAPWEAGLLFALVCAHHARLARAEERFLSASRGEPYRHYLETSARWLGMPGRKPRRAGQGGSGERESPSDPWSEAIRRQGGNLGKTVGAILILWALAAVHT